METNKVRNGKITMITFTKMAATGNDFVVVDARSLSSGLQVLVHKGQDLRLKTKGSELKTENIESVARKLCERKRSIGADGLLIIEDSEEADCRMRVFNPDGTEVDMCGNGVRCVALYVNELSKTVNPVRSSSIRQNTGTPLARTCKEVRIETNAGIIAAEITGEDLVKIKMTDPEGLRLNFDIEVQGVACKANFVNTGVPHVVYFVEDLDKIDIVRIGRATRLHSEFAPDGTNADFINVDKGILYMRTYERGVEDETLACGTGAVASAIVVGALGKLSPPVNVRTRGGELKIDFDLKKGGEGDRKSLHPVGVRKKRDGSIFDRGVYKNVYLEGEAGIVYQGEVNEDV